MDDVFGGGLGVDSRTNSVTRGFIWVILFIGLIQWIGLSILERYPHVYNYLYFTEENAEWQYKNTIMMINVLKKPIVFSSFLSHGKVYRW